MAIVRNVASHCTTPMSKCRLVGVLLVEGVLRHKQALFSSGWAPISKTTGIPTHVVPHSDGVASLILGAAFVFLRLDAQHSPHIQQHALRTSSLLKLATSTAVHLHGSCGGWSVGKSTHVPEIMVLYNKFRRKHGRINSSQPDQDHHR